MRLRVLVSWHPVIHNSGACKGFAAAQLSSGSRSNFCSSSLSSHRECEICIAIVENCQKYLKLCLLINCRLLLLLLLLLQPDCEYSKHSLLFAFTDECCCYCCSCCYCCCSCHCHLQFASTINFQAICIVMVTT